jgi:hypothetical protein
MTDSITHSISDDAGINLSLAADKHCSACAIELCMRQKLINLASGRIETMYCLSCLGKRENVQDSYLLAKIKSYILARQCFEKEWIKYKDPSFCRDSKNCLPHKCSDE